MLKLPAKDIHKPILYMFIFKKLNLKLNWAMHQLADLHVPKPY